MLETQISQVAPQEATSSQTPEVFPSQTETNPKGIINALQLRDGKQLEDPIMKTKTIVGEIESEKQQDITNSEVVENLVYVGTNPPVHNDGDDGGDEEEERIFDGLSLGAKERGFGADSVRKYEDSETKIYLPQVRNLARPVLGLARPCHPPEQLLLLLLRF
ncbi:hypothetical protein MTR_7g034010 [Medicago truncatula]|uniref:Uncharacterized protein n=1 Tax=Medicago truncatula TaxID=3880 RepID=A0A072TXF1_MEDTR|nr:hypothetical protein MTR_7g034010 [Medicago truncatula]